MTSKGTRIAPSLPGGAGQRLVESLDEANACGCSAPGGWGAWPTPAGSAAVLPVVYKLHEGSVVFHTLQGTFTEEGNRATVFAHADYQVAFEIDQIDPDARGGWAVLVVGAGDFMSIPRPNARRSLTPGPTPGRGLRLKLRT